MSTEAMTAAIATNEGGKAAKATAGTKKKLVATKQPKKQAITSVDHPKYSEMIRQALTALKERGGSSRQAVLKYITKNFNLGSDESVVNTHLKLALKAGVKNASLKQSKGTGATGSFRIGTESTAKKASGGGRSKPAPADKKAKSQQRKVSSSNKKPKSVSKPVSAAAAAAKKTTSVEKKKQSTPSAAAPGEKTAGAAASKKVTKSTGGKGAAAKKTKPKKPKSPAKSAAPKAKKSAVSSKKPKATGVAAKK